MNNWIRTRRPKKTDKIPISIFNLNLTENQEISNCSWYNYNNLWIATIWIIDNYLLTYIQYDIYGNEVSRCNNCNNGICSINNHNEHWQLIFDKKNYHKEIKKTKLLNYELYGEIRELKLLNDKLNKEIKELYIDNNRLNFINKEYLDNINDFNREINDNISDIVLSVIDNVID